MSEDMRRHLDVIPFGHVMFIRGSGIGGRRKFGLASVRTSKCRKKEKSRRIGKKKLEKAATPVHLNILGTRVHRKL